MHDLHDEEKNSPPTPEPDKSQQPVGEPLPDSPSPKPGHSTGPRTSAGKAKSSMNRLNHGLRSEKAVLPDEDPAEYEATLQGWVDIYDPRDRKEDELVHALGLAHWHLKRARKRLEEIEWNLPGNACDWTEENHKRFANFSRYKTTDERSFNRSYSDMEAHRGRQFREEQIREKARVAAAAVDLKWLSDKEINTHKALKTAQIVEVEMQDGECITSCYPTNEEITDFYARRKTEPILIKRLLIFMNKDVPLEYAWTNPKLVEGALNKQAVQNMLWPRWLEVIEREEALGTGHIGPMF